MSGPENQPTQDVEGPSKFGSLAGAIGAKNLIIIIIAMPFVFLVAVLGIIALFGNPNDVSGRKPAANDYEAASENAANDTAALIGDAVDYPAGAAPGAIALDGDRLAVRIDGPDGVEVVVYDLAKGEIIARVPFTPE